jgi:nitrite reductase/ring-hydroxylating ferredoxin subunit
MPECTEHLPLCRLDELDVPGSRGLTVTCGDRPHDIFLVRTEAGVFGYLNSCPHTGAPLDWMPDRFLNTDLTHIQCAMHAALFNVQDGFCIAGPCHGDALTAVPLSVEAGVVYLHQCAFCDRQHPARRT